jgi:UDP-N-acetylmuramoyl-L-alanyl-D-glutamate--2,6-diaminopimelate ligase
LIIIDFAHTPDGVLKVLTNIKELSSYKLSVVIGCGGSRDTLKRKTIGDIALKYADRVIFTADNPRDENPLNIINDMIKDTIENNYEIILDRKKAINHTLDTSNPYEVIAILGKGNERSQIINGIMHPFSDKETVYNWIKREKHHDN